MNLKTKNWLQALLIFIALSSSTIFKAQCTLSNFNLAYTCPDAGIHCIANAAGNFAEDDAWIKYGVGNNGQLKKPFVFVEGLDVNIVAIDAHRYGARGWPNFISGTTNEKDPTENMLEKAPLLINELVVSRHFNSHIILRTIKTLYYLKLIYNKNNE